MPFKRGISLFPIQQIINLTFANTFNLQFDYDLITYAISYPYLLTNYDGIRHIRDFSSQYLRKAMTTTTLTVIYRRYAASLIFLNFSCSRVKLTELYLFRNHDIQSCVFRCKEYKLSPCRLYIFPVPYLLLLSNFQRGIHKFQLRNESCFANSDWREAGSRAVSELTTPRFGESAE